jgi:tetratricopeptide (TPR) repeat protein
MASSTVANYSVVGPIVTSDPRFMAGRTLVERGMANDGAVDIFATLLEDCTSKYGESSIESAPAYYEYGNALLRASLRRKEEDHQEQEGKDDGNGDGQQDARRKALAAAAEKRMNVPKSNYAEEDEKTGALDIPTPKESEQNDNEGDTKEDTNGGDHLNNNDNNNNNNSDEEEEDDLTLALEMMENAFSIVDDYNDKNDDNDDDKYSQWVKDQIPRILLGIGDTLSALGRHADAADAYSRSLGLRQSILQDFEPSDTTIEHLIAHRKVVEATILIAEELLTCPPHEDVVTTETQSLIVSAKDRIEYVRGYYDKARDALQEAVFCMGNLAARNVELGQEKEDVCFLATLVMGVGESLAAIDEAEEEAKEEEEQSTEPVKKRTKH